MVDVPAAAPRPQTPTVVVQTAPAASIWRSWVVRLLLLALGVCVMIIFGMMGAYQEYFAHVQPPAEHFHSGDANEPNKILLLQATGAIMPPLTERLIEKIKAAGERDDIKGVLLEVDSPGGLVADSHEIYHRLKQLSEKKPIYVQMKRLAASGGYYIAMGAGPQGKLFVEPTTWTGSIGVIIPRYDVSELAGKLGIDSVPLKTGEFKDALNPFRPMSDSEKAKWENILTQSFEQFKSIIDDNRDTMDADQVAAVATGEVFTAKDAIKNGLVDQEGFLDDSLAALQAKLGLDKARVITLDHPTTLVDVLLGSAEMSSRGRQAKAPASPLEAFLESSVPRAYFLCSWLPSLPQ